MASVRLEMLSQSVAGTQGRGWVWGAEQGGPQGPKQPLLGTLQGPILESVLLVLAASSSICVTRSKSSSHWLSWNHLAELWNHFTVVPSVLCEYDQEYASENLI